MTQILGSKTRLTLLGMAAILIVASALVGMSSSARAGPGWIPLQAVSSRGPGLGARLCAHLLEDMVPDAGSSRLPACGQGAD